VIDQRRKKDSEDLPPALALPRTLLDFKPQARCKESLVKISWISHLYSLVFSLVVPALFVNVTRV
jgi:hypothetical protein